MSRQRTIADPARNAGGSGLSEDTLLGGHVRLFQPATGYRAAIDPVFLAAAIPAHAGEMVLDVGAGAGAAALCLAVRVPGVRVAGVERDRDLVRLAIRNAKVNGLGDHLDIMVGDLKRAPARLAPGSFHHVMANPPFLTPGHGTYPPDAAKAAAVIEGFGNDACGLDDWLAFCALMVRPTGSVTLIHRADRLDEVLARFKERLGDIIVFPLWPGPASPSGAGEKPAKRVIVRGRKGVAAPMRLLPGLVLHTAGGAYTAQAEAVLRHAQALDLSGSGRASG